jgi:hypothetical protein
MKTLLLPVSLFIATSLSLSAKTVKFPEKDPAFSITVPNDWTDKVDKDGDLECEAGDGSSAGFLIQKMDAKTEEEAKTYLNVMIKAAYHGDAKDAKVSESKERTTPTGVKMFGIIYTGPAEGIEMSYMAVAFSPKRETWFALLDIEPAAAAKTHERTGVILNSITPTSVARGGNVKVTAVMATGPKDKPTTSFAADTPKVLALFKTKGAQKGDKLRGVWIADDVGDAAPANTKIDEATLTLEGDTDGNFSCSKPTKGWPAGKYHVDIYAIDKLATTVKFTIEAAEAAEKTETQSAGSADDDQYTFKVKNANVQRITGLLTSEDDTKYIKFDIGKGIDVGEIVTLNWDKSTNKSGCEWYIKAVYADKSVGEAVQFNFCEEDLIIQF